jgi:hypothetical protein
MPYLKDPYHYSSISMSSVCDLGTIRNIIRGVDEPSPNTLLAEMIDDAEHSLSKCVFIDINVRDKQVVIGFENAATEEQLNNMVHWNPTSTIHSTSNISTCGQGLKYYEFRFRGEQIHATKTWDEAKQKFIYRKSLLNSDVIYNSARSPDISETAFSDILKRKTSYVNETDEIESSLDAIFLNAEHKYPFNPKTIIIAKNITNDVLLADFDKPEFSKAVEKELINKYYEEIKAEKLIIYIKLPKDSEFRKLAEHCTVDVIGSTNKQLEHHTDLWYVETGFAQFKKGDYIISINDKMFRIQKMGNSFARLPVSITEGDKSNLIHQFRFVQYNLVVPSTKEEETILKEQMTGTSMEDYCGVYLKIGDKYIHGQPIPCKLTKRNLAGARFYRGILELMNPRRTKMMLGIHGLKSEFNLTHMNSLEEIIKQCCNIYKSFWSKFKDTPTTVWSTVDPETYCVVQTSNKKTVREEKPGHNYIRVVGKNFFKQGIAGSKNREDRIFKPSAADYEEAKLSFPDEELYPVDKQYFVYLSPLNKRYASTEQVVLENIMTLQDVIVYDNKIGDGVREYFHCDNPDTLQEIITMMTSALNS